MKKALALVSFLFLFALVAGGLTSEMVGTSEAEQPMLVAGSHAQGHGGAEAVAEDAAGPQRFCPLTGEAIDRTQFIDHEGKRVYFCCAACKAPFEKDPAKHIKSLESKGVTLEKTAHH